MSLIKKIAQQEFDKVILNQAEDPVFPVSPLGMCFEGVEKLSRHYNGRDVKFAYNSKPSLGHAWVFVDGDPIDSYFGRMPRTYEWMRPEKIFDSYEELDDYQFSKTRIDCTNSDNPLC